MAVVACRTDVAPSGATLQRRVSIREADIHATGVRATEQTVLLAGSLGELPNDADQALHPATLSPHRPRGCTPGVSCTTDFKRFPCLRHSTRARGSAGIVATKLRRNSSGVTCPLTSPPCFPAVHRLHQGSCKSDLGTLAWLTYYHHLAEHWWPCTANRRTSSTWAEHGRVHRPRVFSTTTHFKHNRCTPHAGSAGPPAACGRRQQPDRIALRLAARLLAGAAQKLWTSLAYRASFSTEHSLRAIRARATWKLERTS